MKIDLGRITSHRMYVPFIALILVSLVAYFIKYHLYTAKSLAMLVLMTCGYIVAPVCAMQWFDEKKFGPAIMATCYFLITIAWMIEGS